MKNLIRDIVVCCFIGSAMFQCMWPAVGGPGPCNTKAPHPKKTKCLDMGVCQLNRTACKSSEAWTKAKKYSTSCIQNGAPTAHCIKFRVVCVTKVHCKTVPGKFGIWRCKVDGNVKDPAGDDIVREVDVYGQKSCVVSG